ncbi:MAG: peptide ABC transporter substrate-binding protein [Ruminococcus flavefaciens]|nr:peptide ABC transporter substrate-binding protein [Ruminococcus flavefaciens]
MKKLTILVCMIFTATLFSCGNNDRGDGTGHMYDVSILGNPQSLDPQYAVDSASNTIIKNLYSGLMTADINGNILCCNAESYTISSDGLEYTFTLRQDNYWFFDENDNDIIDDDEYFPVTAKDYVFAFRRILDPAMQSPYAEEFSCIRNGSNIISGKALPETAGVIAVDDYTLNISLDYPCAEFLGLLATSASSPCNRDFFYSTKGRYGLDDRSVMSNGAFFVRQWFYDPYGVNNILYMKKNAVNSNDTNEIIPSFLSFTIESDENDIRNMFRAGDIECFTTENIEGINTKKYNVTSSCSSTLGLIFNPDDKYFSDLSMCKALAFSIDREKILDSDETDLVSAYGIIPPAVSLLGRSYRELVSDKQYGFYDISEAKRCFKVAGAELQTEDFEDIKILVCAGTIDAEYLHRISQQWQEVLGFYIGIDEVTQSEFDSRIAGNDYSIALYSLKGSYNSGLAVIEQFAGNDFLSYSVKGSELVDRVRKCTDVSELVDCYCSQESEILDGYGFIPLFYKNSYLVMQSDNEDIFYDAFTGAVDFKKARNYS